jgi:hypothetical protein
MKNEPKTSICHLSQQMKAYEGFVNQKATYV